MSAVDSHIPPPVIPEHRRHESPVVIDVDALDADDIVYVGSARPTQRRRVGEDGRSVPVTTEVIHITDSEDENEIQFVGHNPAPPEPPLVGRRARIFSPPPPPQIGGIPPVPPIPQRFLRPRPPPGLVIPNEEPLPFEADLRATPPAEQVFPVGAPPSHHVQPLGFGGALLAGVRRIMGPRHVVQRHERRNGWGVSGAFIMRWDPLDFGVDEDFLDELDEIGFLDDEDNSFAGGRVRSQLDRAFKQRDREARAEPDYKPEYTHPDGPSPGFTHDFCPSTPSSVTDDESVGHRASGSGSRSCEATIVCSCCLDSLVLGATDVGEDRAKRKLWSLRCGHLLDGKCIETLMQPVPQTPDGAAPSAKPVEDPPSPSRDTVVVDSDAGSMRSRLRPRRGMAGSPVLVTSSSSGRRGSSLRPQPSHRSNRKGKGKMKGPVVDAEHEWTCPVAGCGRDHLSLLMDGRWTMDEKRGAIAVFV